MVMMMMVANDQYYCLRVRRIGRDGCNKLVVGAQTTTLLGPEQWVPIRNHHNQHIHPNSEYY